MSTTARENYLETQIRTATPQRLRLMLIDGALRFAHMAKDAWGRDGKAEEAYAALLRCRRIVSELFGTIKQDQLPVARDVAMIYLFLFQRLAEVPAQNDPQGISEVIEILEKERETWLQVCEQMPEAPVREDDAPVGCQEITASDTQAIPPDVGFQPPEVEGPKGFSLEA